jgi:hypothetical protein
MASSKKSECEPDDSSKRICRDVLLVPLGSPLQPGIEQRDDRSAEVCSNACAQGPWPGQGFNPDGKPALRRFVFAPGFWRTHLSRRRRRVITIKFGHARHLGHGMDKLPQNVHVLIIDDFFGGVSLPCTG